MAPNLAISQRQMIHDMILSNELTAAQMADAAGCSIRAVKYIRSNLRAFGSVKAPWNGSGRPRSVTPTMLEALREHFGVQQRQRVLKAGNPDLKSSLTY
jgi:hypothetical protein